MARSKSAGSKTGSKSSGNGRKTFTLDEAGRALTYVKRVVGDLVKAHHDAVSTQTAVSAATAGPERTKRQADFERAVERLQELATELAATGVELKDSATGLIDFPGTHNGKPVYLCWRLGEDKVGFFHDIEAGFGGRKPISELVEK